MFAALLLALVGGVALFLWGRPPAKERAEEQLVRRLIDLAVQDQAGAMRLLREHPQLLGARYLHDETLLHFCAAEGLVPGVRFFAGAGVPIDAVNEFGETALMDAAALGNLEVVKVLLRHGADPNASSRTSDRALHAAVAHGHVELVAALLDAGARADYVSVLGESVWDAVGRAASRREEVARVLERHGVRR